MTLDACNTGRGKTNIAMDVARTLSTAVTAPNARTLTFGTHDLGVWNSMNIPFTDRTIPILPGTWITYGP
jgi:hypothetical protein